jgi:hypothetical protein
LSTSAEAGRPDLEFELCLHLLHLVIVFRYVPRIMAAHYVAILIFVVIFLILHEKLPFLKACACALVAITIVILLLDVIVSQVPSPSHHDHLLVFVSLMVGHSWLQSACRMLGLLAFCLYVLFIFVESTILGGAFELLGVNALK